jgi:predicted Zn-dependent protease
MIRAKIDIDAGRQATPGQLKATLIHELTHAIGCGGHFSALTDRRRSVLYESSQITAWSQNDAAVIRVLYSPWIKSGMTAAQAQASLRRHARSVD